MQKIKNPILVTGPHRSGTTWIGKTISQHPKVRYVQEPFHVDYPDEIMGLKLDTWFTHFKSSDRQAEIISSFNNLLLSNPVKSTVAKCRAIGVDAKFPLRFAKHFALELLKPRVLIKDPLALLSAGWLYETYDFSVICMTRHPLAFVSSLKMAGWDFDFENLRRQPALMAGPLKDFSDAVDDICTRGSEADLIDRATLLWNILNAVILQYQRHYPNWLFMKHEDILMDPHRGFKVIFDYLTLELDEKICDYVDRYTSDKNIDSSVSVFYQPRNRKAILNAWRDRLSHSEISRVRAATGDIAAQIYDEVLV